MRLKDKTVLITGAARGIGQATAVELARSGAHIIGVDLDLIDLQDTADAVRQLGRKFHAFACDIRNHLAVQNTVEAAARTDAGFDVLVNNAGVMASGLFTDRDLDTWRKIIETNLMALIGLTYEALPHLRKREWAHIVNLASVAGKFGTEGVAVYAASKHGVVGFSSALRFELAETHIGVSWICPSLVNTRMSRGVPYTLLTPMVQREDVARAIRTAIETNAAEIFVPGRVRLGVAILPALAPNLARKITRWTKASHGWVTARKEIQVHDT